MTVRPVKMPFMAVIFALTAYIICVATKISIERSVLKSNLEGFIIKDSPARTHDAVLNV